MTLTQVYAPALKFAVLFGVEGLAFLVIAIFSTLHLRSGAWAVLGVVGGLVGAVPEALWSVGWARVELANDSRIFDFVSRHELLVQLDWSRPVAIVLVAAAFIVGNGNQLNRRR